MGWEKVILIANISLAIVGLMLFLSLFELGLPSIGEAQYALLGGEPRCFVNADDVISPMAMDMCCFAARKQLSCNEQTGIVDGQAINRQCSTGSSTVSYLLNAKGFLYCQQQAFWRYE